MYIFWCIFNVFCLKSIIARAFIDDVECSLHRLETSATEIGLTISYNKTKAMNLGKASVRHVRFANGDPVDSCDKFEYLGAPISNAETVFRSRLSKAWAAATKLQCWWPYHISMTQSHMLPGSLSNFNYFFATKLHHPY